MADRFFRILSTVLCAAMLLILSACNRAKPDPNAIVMLIESSPTSLDPRIGIDAQSEHIDELIFDSLVRKDDHFNLQPWLADRWETPDPLTWIFHLHPGVRFHNGQLLTSADVKWTFDSILSSKVITVKKGTYDTVDSVEARDPLTVVFHMKKPDATLLWNLSDGAIGIVPNGSARDFQQRPIGTGPFRFVSQEIDKEVVIERNPDSWQPLPDISRIRFSVVPEAITRALELQKGSADVALNALTSDLVYSLEHEKKLQIETGPGSVVAYLNFNLRDPVLSDLRVRQAISLAIDRRLIIHSLLRDHARVAASLLPPEHWAYAGDFSSTFDPAQARQMLDAAGFKPDARGIRFHLTMKTSTDEGTRLLAAILQQQLHSIGIQLDLRSFEFATFYADVVRGAFQIYSLRWVGGNEDPDIFRYALATASFPPKGANRGHYSNAKLDALITAAATQSDQETRRKLYAQAQQIIAADVPTLPLWYLDSVIIHSQRLSGITVSPLANFDFLRTAKVAAN